VLHGTAIVDQHQLVLLLLLLLLLAPTLLV
jgi:hypothetical protein